MRSEYLPNLKFERIAAGEPLKVAGTQAQLGTVVLIQHPKMESFVVIEKAVREGYEFGNMLALPGGMCRSVVVNRTVDEELIDTAHSRVLAETSIDLASHDLRPLPISRLPVTRYSVEGSMKYVIILPWITTLEPPFTEVKSSDRSVSLAQWHTKTVDLARFSPANRLIVAATFWCCMSPEDRLRAEPQIEEARQFCNQSAQLCNLTLKQRRSSKDGFLNDFP